VFSAAMRLARPFGFHDSTAGVSRSVTIAVAYIVTVTGLDWDIALTAITARRPCACPNEGFRRQLIVYQANAAAVRIKTACRAISDPLCANVPYNTFPALERVFFS
jgi:hypothetical protein